MDIPLRVLILEDRPADAELMEEELRKAGFTPECRRVDTERGYLAALDPSLDVILADHSLPRFDAVRALQRLQERGLDVPFLIVSGMIGEELAVSLMRKGAADYVCKDRLARLGPAVLRALERKRLQDEKQLAERRLLASERRFRALIEHGSEGIVLFSAQAKLLYSSPSSLRILGYAPEELVGRNVFDLVHPDDFASTHTQLDRLLESPGGVVSSTRHVLHKDGSWRWLDWVGTNLLAEPDVEAIVINYRDITERKRADERLRKLSRAIEQSPVMVLITDPKGSLEYINPRFSAVTGYTLDEVQGKNPRIFSSGETPSEEYRRLWETISAGGEWRGELHDKKKDGGLFWVSASISPVLNEEGVITHFICIEEDITERKRAEAMLRQATEAAEAASRSKGEFLANVSHEIRTPMNAILGMMDITLATRLTPEQRENLEIVKSATDSLLSIINDLLDFSKMEAGRLQLDPVELNLRDNLGDMLAMLRLRAHAKGLELACRVHPDVPDQLIGDPARLRQVLVNLVGNAIKFTERGEVVVDVEAEPQSGGEVVLHFRVTDTGIGVPPDKREAIFAPFTQADGSLTRLYGGTGLGLAISSQLVSLMGGRIWVESEVGRGSTFHFTAHLVLSREVQSAEPASLESLRDVRVLVVDDNAVNRRILEEILTRWRMKLTLADGGVAALTHIERARDAGTPFSLVLVDALMEDMDGFTVAERIDADPGLEGTVVLMLSPSHRQGAARRLRGGAIKLRGGATLACLSKPIRQSELRAAILAVVAPTPRAENHNQPSPVGPSLQRPSVRPLSILLAEDNPFNQRVVVLMLARFGHAVTSAVNGREAVAALERQSFDLVLMDLQMPKMDGFQATAAIRSAEAGTARHVPIIALTAHAMREDRGRCLEAGMDGYVSKPIEEDKLRQAIEDCLSRTGVTAEVEPPDGASGCPMDVAGALARVDGDRGFLREMARMFAEETPSLLTEIRHAIATSDAAGLVAPAHTLKNWAGNFVASAAFEAVAELERLGRLGTLATAEAAHATLEREIERLGRALSRFDAESDPFDRDGTLLAIEKDPRSPACTP